MTEQILDAEAYNLARRFVVAHLDRNEPTSEAIVRCMKADPYMLPDRLVRMAQNVITECSKHAGLGDETMFLLMKAEALDSF